MTSWISASVNGNADLPPEYADLITADALARRYGITPTQARELTWRDYLAASAGSIMESMQVRRAIP